jgi:hypothetical protein
MNYMNATRFTRLVRLLKASNHEIPLDVQAYGEMRGFIIEGVTPATGYDPRELANILELAGIDPADVIHEEVLEVEPRPVPGCMCYGANTPELNGFCACQGIHL